jgi:hypothetical protein
VLDKVISDTHIPSGPLPEGQYSWSVSSLDKDGQEGASSRLRIYNITPVEPMDAPQLNVPVVK